MGLACFIEKLLGGTVAPSEIPVQKVHGVISFCTYIINVAVPVVSTTIV